MKLIIIYGPPASGKLTVAKALSKKTGYKLFHNHIVNDALSEIIDFEDENYWKAADKLKLELIETASRYGVKGMIFTMVYVGNKEGVDLPRRIKRVVEKDKGKAYFVKVECDEDKLLKRVVNKDRRKYKKFGNARKLKKYIRNHKVFESLPFRDQLVINTSGTSAVENAERIVKHFGLGVGR